MESVSGWDPDDDRLRVYLAGPMSGYPDYNRPVFAGAAAVLRREGWQVFDPGSADAHDGLVDGVATHRDYMARDLPVVMGADRVVVLPGWQSSAGARLEVHTALVCGVTVVDYATGEEVLALDEADGPAAAFTPPPSPAPAACGGTDSPGAWRVTDPATGGQKDAKPARMSLVPMDALLAVAEVFHHGGQKYADHNWALGYRWSLGFDAMLRHVAAWWQGTDTDDESGHDHLAHAAWHALVLLAMTKRAVGTDDRPHVMVADLAAERNVAAARRG